MTPFTVAIIATFRRATQLDQLLSSLENIEKGLGAVIVIDNGDDPAAQQVCNGRSVELRYFAQEGNVGCGGGLRLGEHYAFQLFGDRLTHLWILDDDAVAARDSLDVLLDAMGTEAADAACPMLVDSDGRLRWYAGLLDKARFESIRRSKTPEEYLVESGPSPVPFSWSTGISFLVSRRAMETAGFHRSDFWIRGEDLEYSLRITARYKGIFVPLALVEHRVSADHNERAEYLKRCAHLQNISYTALRLTHGRRIILKLPGNFFQFLRGSHWATHALLDAGRAFLRGAIVGQPVGAPQSQDASFSPLPLAPRNQR